MAGSTTQTSIVNRALQLLGYQSISSINQNDRGAKAMLRAYQPVLLAMLRANHWNFSIRRISIAASATQPIFGKANYFPLPGDFIDLANPDVNTYVTGGGTTLGPVQSNDWQIEGQAIVSDDIGPLNVRYVTSNVTEDQFDTLFAEAFAASLAMNTCEELTQSNSKIQTASAVFDQTMKVAKQRNAFENKPAPAPLDSWISSRF